MNIISCVLLRIFIVVLLSIVASHVESFASIDPTPKRSKALTSPASSLFAIANPFKTSDKKNANEKKEDSKQAKLVKQKKKQNILHVDSITEYKEQVVNESEHITVVRFYSSYCRSCKASQPHFYKLAREFQGLGVKFVEVPLTKHTSILHEALEVPSLPWTHIYHPDAGLVEERKVSKKFIDEVRQCLRCYVYGECSLEDAPAGCKVVYGECALED